MTLDRTAWVTFEAPDEPFWPAVVGGLERLDVTAPPVPGHAAIDRQTMLSLATALARLPERVTLVVDGYELVDREMAADVDFLLRHSGHRLRLIFVTRCDPVLPLYRYRLEERVAELRIAELAFTDDEASELLVRSGVTLAPSSVRAFNTRTGGWAVGLRFAARILATCEDPDQGVEEVTGDRGNIAEYLLGEVLNAQEPEVRELLLSTSVADTLQPGLTEELGGRSAGRTLALLTKANAFVEPVPEHARVLPLPPLLPRHAARRARVRVAGADGGSSAARCRVVRPRGPPRGGGEPLRGHRGLGGRGGGDRGRAGRGGAAARRYDGSRGPQPRRPAGGAGQPGRVHRPCRRWRSQPGTGSASASRWTSRGCSCRPSRGCITEPSRLTIEVLQVVQARLLGEPAATLGLVEQAEQTMSAPENRFRVESVPSSSPSSS